MDVSESFTPDRQPGPPIPTRVSGSKPSGLTLVLPPLKDGKPIKVGKKLKKPQGEPGVQDEERKIPRPVKLKPLKEVLTKLIAQIKKKDDYAFFLTPVDPSQTPGYSDVIKRPMDLGTMTIKVNKGKYRSLEDFTSDLRLVTSNAKIFNPPGTIYHTEADRIETWGLDHISKAASTVIQYETDWNIEIEKDDDGQTVNIDDDDDDYNAGTPMDIDDLGHSGRSPSVASQVQPSRRGARGPYKKSANATHPNTLSETLDAEGRLPGSKDGLGVFPPGSDWARTMLALKLKGKRYKTKKERMRIEKEGPPLLPDGSLDYAEMEDPFSVLSYFAPEPLSRPYVTPLYPPLFTSSQPQPQYEPSTSQSQPPRPPTLFPTSINVPLHHPSPKLPKSASIHTAGTQRRHWVITRNVTRSKGKEKDDDPEAVELPWWKTPREPHAVDFGSFSALTGAIEQEMRRRNVTGKEGDEEAKLFDTIRESLNSGAAASNKGPPDKDISGVGVATTDYWNLQRAAVAEEYIRDIVYGGPDGLAYVRSLAEFVAIEQGQVVKPCPDLGTISLATWVERNIVDSLTEGRHALLRETAFELAAQSRSGSPHQLDDMKGAPDATSIATQVSKSLHVYPSATVALSALLQIKTHKIDMGFLIKTPGELFLSEEEWVGKIFRERRKSRGETVGKAEVEFEVEEPEKTWMDVDASTKPTDGSVQGAEYELEGPEELNEVLDYVAEVIVSLDKKIKEKSPPSKRGSTTKGSDVQDVSMSPYQEQGLEAPVGGDEGRVHMHHDGPVSSADTSEAMEDPVLRNLRLNLLALAKRAPLDTIARLPKDLVPEHIRHFVPTLGASG